jgi:membrane protein implicated in regulation of membrane protease activity
MAFSRGRSTEVIAVEVSLLALTAAAFAASLSPTVEFWFNAVGFVLLGAGALWIVVALVRREMRIRRRLDAIRNEPSAVREWRTARAPEPRHTSTDRRSA